MALIYNKATGDNTLILGTREWFTRPFAFGPLWTQMAMGMFVSGTTSGSSNANPPTEFVTWHTLSDNVLIGIRNSTSTAFPGTAGSLFCGLAPHNNSAAGGESSNSNGIEYSTPSSQMVAIGYSGATVVAGSYPTYSMGAGPQFSAPSGTSGYCGFFAMQFTIANLGLSTQTMTIQTSISSAISGTDYSTNNLRSLILGAFWSSSKTIQWNNGSAAYAIPDAVFVYMPFYNCRLRISAIELIRLLP